MNTLQNYYRLHAPVYDISRWSFLFGRQKLIDLIPDLSEPSQILDIGCGTGYHLKILAENNYDHQLLGIDLSPDMLKICRAKTNHLDNTEIIEGDFLDVPLQNESFDLILSSYSLSMMQDPMAALSRINNLLKPGAYFALLDFSDSRYHWFKRWMGVNHVSFDPNIIQYVRDEMKPVHHIRDEVYNGLWDYELLISRKISKE